MDESELIKYFIRSQKGVYFERIMSTLGQKFVDCVKMGNFIEEATNSGKIKSANNSSKSTQLESIEGAKEENEEEIFVMIPHHSIPESSQSPQSPDNELMQILNHTFHHAYNIQQITFSPKIPHTKIHHNHAYQSNVNLSKSDPFCAKTKFKG